MNTSRSPSPETFSAMFSYANSVLISAFTVPTRGFNLLRSATSGAFRMTFTLLITTDNQIRRIALLASRTAFLFLHNLMAKLANNWRFQHLLNRPTAPYAIFKKSTLKSLLPRPLSKWLCFAPVCKQVIIRAIKILIPQSGPTAVRSAIVSVRIFAVDCGVFLTELLNVNKIRALHLFLKVFKRSPQTFNASPAVALEPVMLGVRASLFHRAPYLIKPRSRHSMFHILQYTTDSANQLYTPLWTSQLTDFFNKVKGENK